MLRRKAYERLLQWKNNDHKKALCIIGARQIGKTFIIRQFAQENYDHFIEINFILNPEARKIFAGSLDANTIIENMTAFTLQEFVPKKTLILFDEIQECPNARTAIKSLVQDGRFDYIESGSLLGVKFKEVPSYPVGFEEIYLMYPLDFEEFLWANDIQKETIELLTEAYRNRKHVSDIIHDTLIKLFYLYIVVGGMPDVVNSYIETHDIARVVNIQKDILEAYKQDINKYTLLKEKSKVKAVFDSIASQLDEKNRRFIVSSIQKDAKQVRYQDAINWLNDAGTTLPCYNIVEPRIPLSINHKRNLFKLFMLDTGLLCASCNNNVQFALLNGNVEINMGSILENCIAQQLKANGFDLYYFNSKKYGEIDFVVEKGLNIQYIEVKSGANYQSHKALDNVEKVIEWKHNKNIVLCKDQIQETNDTIYYPWYMVMFIKNNEKQDSFIYEIDLSKLS